MIEDYEVEDYEEATYSSLQILKMMGIRIICDGEDITDRIKNC